MRLLKLKVFIMKLLRWGHLIPDVWYSCEIELASIRAAEQAKLKAMIELGLHWDGSAVKAEQS